MNNIAVHPAWQSRGLGGVLMLDLVRTGLARGVRHLTLEVRVGNEPALALYGRFGLAPVGVRPNYYPGGEDALIMWRTPATLQGRLDDVPAADPVAHHRP